MRDGLVEEDREARWWRRQFVDGRACRLVCSVLCRRRGMLLPGVRDVDRVLLSIRLVIALLVGDHGVRVDARLFLVVASVIMVVIEVIRSTSC
jgi:hypothetical protein